MSRGDLSESEWRVLKDLLPIEVVNRGRRCHPEQNRAIINGILWRLRCGTPWRDVPPKYGNWNTIYRRFRRWSKAEVWEAVSVTLAEIMADSGHYTSIAPRFAPMFRQRAERGIHRRALGRRSRGRFTSRLHCLANAKGRPFAFYLTVGETADCKAYDRLIVSATNSPLLSALTGSQ